MRTEAGPTCASAQRASSATTVRQVGRWEQVPAPHPPPAPGGPSHPRRRSQPLVQPGRAELTAAPESWSSRLLRLETLPIFSLIGLATVWGCLFNMTLPLLISLSSWDACLLGARPGLSSGLGWAGPAAPCCAGCPLQASEGCTEDEVCRPGTAGWGGEEAWAEARRDRWWPADLTAQAWAGQGHTRRTEVSGCDSDKVVCPCLLQRHWEPPDPSAGLGVQDPSVPVVPAGGGELGPLAAWLPAAPHKGPALCSPPSHHVPAHLGVEWRWDGLAQEGRGPCPTFRWGLQQAPHSPVRQCPLRLLPNPCL